MHYVQYCKHRIHGRVFPMVSKFSPSWSLLFYFNKLGLHIRIKNTPTHKNLRIFQHIHLLHLTIFTDRQNIAGKPINIPRKPINKRENLSISRENLSNGATINRIQVLNRTSTIHSHKPWAVYFIATKLQDWIQPFKDNTYVSTLGG